MPIITKPSEALKLALNIIQLDNSPWSTYNLNRGNHKFTCNALDYLEDAEEITKEAQEAALDALWNNTTKKHIPIEKLRRIGWFNTQVDRINAINKTIEELEAKGE